MSKGFWAIIGILVVIFGGVLLFKGDEANAPSNGSTASNHVKGENAKGVVLLEYGDFECPFCGQFHPIVEEVVKKYEKDIQFQFRHLPLPQHTNAFAAARAAEAADKQDKFWEMYTVLFQNQTEWASQNDAVPVFEQYAKQLGLDVKQFKADFGSSAVNATINADKAAFNKTGAKVSTPTFFLDGKQINPQNAADFSKLIDEAIAKKHNTQE